MSRSEGRTYRLDPLDSSGVFLGLGVIQCILVGAGLASAVAGVSLGVPLPLAAIPLVLGVAASFVRVGAYVAWEWIPIGAAWVGMRLGRGPKWFARLPLLGPDGGAEPLETPPSLGDLDLLEVPAGETTIGAVRDRASGTLTAVVPVSGPEFATKAKADQEQLLTGWGAVIGQFSGSGSAVSHLAWSDHAVQAGLPDHRQWVSSVRRGTRQPDAVDSYRELLACAGANATRHDVVVAITVARDRLPRRTPTGDPEGTLAKALVAAVDALRRSCTGNGLSSANALGTDGIRQLLRSRIDPFTAKEPRAGRLVQLLGIGDGSFAGPLAVGIERHHVKVDGALHRTYWACGWPRLPQHPGWLDPFLSQGPANRVTTVYFQPVPAHTSRRRIERDLVKLDSDATVRTDRGQRVDARHRRATQALLDREEELVAGFAEVRTMALVGVAAPDLLTLEAQSELVEQAAREVGIDLRLLDHRQDVAWAASLPFGLAPRHGIV